MHEACHNNGNRSDNRLENLRWDTAKENQKDRDLHGTGQQGENGPNAKLSNEQVLEMRRLRNLGKSVVDLSELFKTPESTVRKIVGFHSWKSIK